MPSSRSIAFRRTAYDAAGGYPEWLEVGEDMYFDHRLVSSARAWTTPPTRSCSGAPVRRSAKRGASTPATREGDALAGMYPERHFLRFAVYGLASGR